MGPMRFLIGLCGVLVAGIGARADTDVCGTLSLPQEWTSAGSPYRITGDVFVPASSQLRIDPGVEVRIARRASPCDSIADSLRAGDHADSALIGLVVQGSFYCVGSPNRPVRFMPQDSGQVEWEGIRLGAMAPGTVEIAFTEFHGADRAVWSEYSRFFVHHVLFQGNNVGMWLGAQADLTVLQCDFVGNRVAGIRIDQAAPRIVDNIFYRNLGDGIGVQTGGAFSIAYNDFYGNTEEDCFHCPYAVLRPSGQNANGDTTDAFSNLNCDPLFVGTPAVRALEAADPNRDTPSYLVKDAKIAHMEKKSRLLFWRHGPHTAPPFAPRGAGPFVLSRYSKLIHAGHPAKDLRNPDQTTADIGLHGGPQTRITSDPF